MNCGQDLGGMHGLGPVEPETDEPWFHAEWERRCFALTLAMGASGKWNLDKSRFAREDRHPADYMRMSYYEIWLAGLERLLADAGMVADGELDGASRSSPAPQPGNVLKAEDVTQTLGRGGPTSRSEGTPPRFSVGDRVRVLPSITRGHTRSPRYVRGRTGTITRDHGVFVFPDSNAAGTGENPQHLYSVAFDATDLWGPEAKSQDRVHLDLWDDYLESAAR